MRRLAATFFAILFATCAAGVATHKMDDARYWFPWEIQGGPLHFAQLETTNVPDGTMSFCDDCLAGSIPCSTPGDGSFAFREGGIWKCNRAGSADCTALLGCDCPGACSTVTTTSTSTTTTTLPPCDTICTGPPGTDPELPECNTICTGTCTANDVPCDINLPFSCCEGICAVLQPDPPGPLDIECTTACPPNNPCIDVCPDPLVPCAVCNGFRCEALVCGCD